MRSSWSWPRTSSWMATHLKLAARGARSGLLLLARQEAWEDLFMGGIPPNSQESLWKGWAGQMRGRGLPQSLLHYLSSRQSRYGLQVMQLQ